jgi:hypothetical protein
MQRAVRQEDDTRHRPRHDDLSHYSCPSRARDSSYPTRFRSRPDSDTPRLLDEDPSKKRRDILWQSNQRVDARSRPNNLVFATLGSVFRPPIDADAALEAVKLADGVLTATDISGLVRRIGKSLTSSTAEHLTGAFDGRHDTVVDNSFRSYHPDASIKILTLLETLYKQYLLAERNLLPENLAGCCRNLMLYEQLYNSITDRSLSHILHPKTLFAEFAGLWLSALSWHAEQIRMTHICHAIIGFLPHRTLFFLHDPSVDRDTAMLAEALEMSCDLFTKSLELPSAKDLPSILRVLRAFTSSQIVSMHSVEKIAEKIWLKDAHGLTMFDQVGWDEDEALQHRVDALNRLSSFNCFNKEELTRIEAALRARISSSAPCTISPHIVADFLSASFFHSHDVDKSFAEQLEEVVVKGLTDTTLSLHAFHKVAHFSALGLLIYKGPLSEQMKRIAKKAADCSEFETSDQEASVERALQRMGFKYEAQMMIAPCSLDFAVQTPSGRMLNLEIDGTPFHFVWLIDTKNFDEQSLSAPNRMRDEALRKLHIPVVRLRSSEISNLSHQEFGTLLKSKIKEVLPTAR